MTELYNSLGYKGNPCGTFVSVVNDMLKKESIEYNVETKHSSIRALKKVGKNN